MKRPILFVVLLYALAALIWPAGVLCYGQLAPATQPSTRPTTQPATAPEVIALDAIKLPADGGTVPLLAGRVYTLAKTKTLACALVKSGTGPNPVVCYSGGRDSSALQVPADRVGATVDVDFELARGVYAVNNSGTFNGSGATVRGGGGFLKAIGDTGMATLERWVALDQGNNYIVYVGPALTQCVPPADVKSLDGTVQKAGSVAYAMRPGRGVTMIGCRVEKGTNSQHIFRAHYQQQVRIIDCVFVDVDRLGAAVRIHDVLSAEVLRTAIAGDVDFGPLCEEDGGKNEPPGAKRVYCDQMRLGTLSVTRCRIDAEQIKLNPGVLNLHFTRSTFSAHRSGALFEMPWPYMNRPASRGVIDGCTLLYRGTGGGAGGDGGRIFGSSNGAALIKLTGGTTFNGKNVD
jgi:hypothetical protein